jgi:hypothetical protein
MEVRPPAGQIDYRPQVRGRQAGKNSVRMGKAEAQRATIVMP